MIIAHPDDESVGIAGQLPRLRRATLIHLTDGAPHDLAFARYCGFDSRKSYADARQRELDAALDLAGVPRKLRISLNVPDQQVARNLVATTYRLMDLISTAGFEFVLTHPYEGGHPDHDATAFCVHSACELMSRRGLTPPVIVEMASYFEGENGGVYQKFIPHSEHDEVVAVLSDTQRDLKRQMLAAHRTQASSLCLFEANEERFRTAPNYDFTRLPNDGCLHYENFRSGMSRDTWPELVREAIEDLRTVAEAA